MPDLRTTIGLEIHVQLKTKSKMFCRCDNNAEGKAPNTVVCPICLAMPGSLPVANEQAILWTIKTGLALGCTIPKLAKFDRKHYFYPDLPKGYQISQYDEPFAIGGEVKIGENTIRINRVHLEEDAGKLIHSGNKSLVDLNRAGTPLMEIVTEPDIHSPAEAGDFLRRLQKIVRDEVAVSEASMEKGHLRCDANISITDGKKMSEIVELKNLNSFKFVEKALTIEEARLKEEYPNWPEKKGKVTRGYDSKQNTTYEQRTKEEAADYRYFPEPDLPPFLSSSYDLNELAQVSLSEEKRSGAYKEQGVSENYANSLASNAKKADVFERLLESNSGGEPRVDSNFIAGIIVNNVMGFILTEEDLDLAGEYIKAIEEFKLDKTNKQQFRQLSEIIHKNRIVYADALKTLGPTGEDAESETEGIVEAVLKENPKEVEAYKNGRLQLFGFFVGEVMKKSGGKANPKVASELLKKYLV